MEGQGEGEGDGVMSEMKFHGCPKDYYIRIIWQY
jgi:hypothetical protein